MALGQVDACRREPSTKYEVLSVSPLQGRFQCLYLMTVVCAELLDRPLEAKYDVVGFRHRLRAYGCRSGYR